MRLFVRLNTGYFTHPKTVKLFLALGTDAFWIPPRLWCWAANHRADGNLEGMSAGEIAMHVGYSGNAQAMLGALLDCVFLDPEPLRIHDWDEHNAYHVAFAEKARLAAAARWAKKKEPKKKREDIDKREGASIAQAMLGASDPRSLSPCEEVLAEIPTVEDVVTVGAGGSGIPQDYCRYYHAKKTETHGWVKNGRLIVWRGELVRWWQGDRENWMARKRQRNGEIPESGTTSL